jgi:hypothetical protein
MPICQSWTNWETQQGYLWTDGLDREWIPYKEPDWYKIDWNKMKRHEELIEEMLNYADELERLNHD